MEENKELGVIEQEEEKPKEPLSELYAKFQVFPILTPTGQKIWEFGSKGRTKMLRFQMKENFGNAEINDYMAIPPQRREGEKDPEYKNRQRFQQALYKFRNIIYTFPKKTQKHMKAIYKRNKKEAGIAYAD